MGGGQGTGEAAAVSPMKERYVALLRGINVGGHNIIAKDDLRHCFEEMGFTRVRTYIQSGNIVFRAAQGEGEQLTARVEAGLSERFSYAARAVVLSYAEYRALLDAAPSAWGEDPRLPAQRAVHAGRNHAGPRAGKHPSGQGGIGNGCRRPRCHLLVGREKARHPLRLREAAGTPRLPTDHDPQPQHGAPTRRAARRDLMVAQYVGYQAGEAGQHRPAVQSVGGAECGNGSVLVVSGDGAARRVHDPYQPYPRIQAHRRLGVHVDRRSRGKITSTTRSGVTSAYPIAGKLPRNRSWDMNA